MAIILNGSTHSLRSASFGASRPSAYSIATFWQSSETGIASGTDKCIMSVGNSAAYPNDLGDLQLYWRSPSGENNCRTTIHTSGAGYPATNTAGNTSADTWFHHCATYAATRHRFYQDGAQVGATANVTVTAAAPSDWLVYLGEQCGNVQKSIGWICMAAYWDVELSADDVAALAKGFSPHHIRPDALRYFVPGLRDANAVVGVTATASNLTFNDNNPRIYA
jgi:hypothetical protein